MAQSGPPGPLGGRPGAAEMAHCGCCLAVSSGVTGFPWLTPQPGSESQKKGSWVKHWVSAGPLAPEVMPSFSALSPSTGRRLFATFGEEESS